MGENSSVGYSIFDETMVDMTWPEIERAAGQGAIVLLPTGVIEEHGPHMGLGVDIYASYMICKLTRRQLEARNISTLIAPPYYWGINHATGAFAGSFTVREGTMKAVLYDILSSLQHWGLNQAFNINWHGEYGQSVAIFEAIKEARADIGIEAYCILSDFDARRFRLTGKEDYVIIHKAPPPEAPPPEYIDLHAGSLETSIMWHYFPDQINAELARTLKSTALTYDELKVWGQGGSAARELTPLGYLGDPAGFATEAGKQVIEGHARDFANLIEDFMKGNYQPPEIK